jgi:hypothetical protein
MNHKKCNYCNKLQLNTHQNSLKTQKKCEKMCRCKYVIKQDKNNIKQDEEINYDLKNLIKELIIHKYFI